MDKPELRIIQLSDLHLDENPKFELLGVNTKNSLQAVIDALKQKEKIADVILLTGDLSQNGSAKSYQYIADMLSVLKAPVYYVAGNHDSITVMNKVYPRGAVKNDKHLVFTSWQLILLNSQQFGKVYGYIDHEQLEFLEKSLRTHPDKKTLIVLHHHPIPIGCRWLDHLGLSNSHDFWAILTRYPSVKVIIYGHVHQESEQIKQGITCYSAPATCIQFKPKQVYFALEQLPPGYRWIELFADGTITTGVEHIAEYVGVFDENAKGY